MKKRKTKIEIIDDKLKKVEAELQALFPSESEIDKVKEDSEKLCQILNILWKQGTYK